MRKIYYKEGENITNKKDYILKLFEDNKFPATYYKDNDFIQCRRVYRRSFMDIFWLFKSKFKTATKGELARILLDKRNFKVGLFYCPDIGRLVLDIRTNDVVLMESFINDDTDLINCKYLREEYRREGPTFNKIVNYAFRSKSFKSNNINFNPFITL